MHIILTNTATGTRRVIEAKGPMSQYISRDRFATRGDRDWVLDGTERFVRFVDATGLNCRGAYYPPIAPNIDRHGRFLHAAGLPQRAVDDPLLWTQNGERCYTVEPRDDAREHLLNWLPQTDWQWAELPEWRMRNPAGAGSLFFLSNDLDISPVVERLTSLRDSAGI